MRAPAWPLASIAVLLASLAAAPAFGQATTTPTTATAQASSVAFTDETPIATNVPALRDAKQLTVRVTNLLPTEQRVTVSVVGLRPAAVGAGDLGGKVFAIDGRDVPAGDSPELVLKLTPAGLDLLKEAQYSGSIVAVGQGGGPIARLALTITKEVAAAAKPSPLPYPDVTLTALNYAPSFLSPLGPGLLVLGVIALLLALVWWLNPRLFGAWRSKRRRLGTLLGALLVVAGVAAGVAGALLGTFGERNPKAAALDGQPAAALIATKSAKVASGATQGRVGSASSAQGDVVDLEVRGSKLAPTGLARAGSYAGKIDLNGDTAGGEATATVKAHDWWPWALLTIGLGVGLGYWLRRYFTTDRPVQTIQTDLDELWREIAAAESAFALEAAGQPYGGLSMILRARAGYREITRLLRENNTADATKAVQALRDQHEAFKALRHAAAELGVLAAQLRTAIRSQAFGVDRGAVDALRLADDAWRAAGDDEEIIPAAGTELAGAKAVDEATALLRDMLPLHASIAANLATAEMLHTRAPRRKMKDRSEFVATFRSIGQLLLRAGSPTAVEAVEKADDSAAEELLAAVAAERTTGIVTEQHVRDMPGIDEIGGSLVRAMQITAPQMIVLGERRPPAFGCRVLTPTGDVVGATGDGDDLFELEARFEGTAGETHTVHWTLGDDAREVDQSVVIADTPGTAARLRHQFAGTAGRVPITVADSGSGSTKATASVDRPGRAAGERKAFKAHDRQMSLLAGVVALGSGMVALYFADGAWGVPNDYLTAVLWGGGVAEGVKLLPALGTYVLPGAK